MTQIQVTPWYTLGVALAFTVLVLVYLLPSFVIYWKLFRKAGHAGWRYIVPIDGQSTMGTIAGIPGFGFATGIIWALYWINVFARTFLVDVPDYYTWTIGILFVGSSLILIGAFMRKYDAGIGRWILFVFLPLIGMFFAGSVKYKGGAVGSDTAPSVPAPSAPGTEQQAQDTDTTPSQPQL